MGRPGWCEDESCSPLCYILTLGGGQCIGELSVPTDHINNAINTMSRCHYDKELDFVNSFHINLADIIVETYLNAKALRTLNLKLPEDIVEYLPKEE